MILPDQPLTYSFRECARPIPRAAPQIAPHHDAVNADLRVRKGTKPAGYLTPTLLLERLLNADFDCRTNGLLAAYKIRKLKSVSLKAIFSVYKQLITYPNFGSPLTFRR